MQKTRKLNKRVVIASGFYDMVLVGGVEEMSKRTTEQVAEGLAMHLKARYLHRENEGAQETCLAFEPYQVVNRSMKWKY